MALSERRVDRAVRGGADGAARPKGWWPKTANVLNYLPKSVQKKAKSDLRQIYNVESRTGAEEAFDRFLAKYGAKYEKAGACLAKDRDTALAMVFKLVKSVQRHWHRLKGTNRLGEIIDGIKFRDREPIKNAENHAAA